MRAKTLSVDAWVHSRLALLRKVTLVRWLLAILLLVGAILFVPTAAEFIVALHNRYSSYPLGTDTSMLANSIGLSGVLSLAIAWAIGYLLGIGPQKARLTIALLLLAGILCIIDIANWLGWIALLVFVLNIVQSFRTKVFFLVPLLAFLIMLVSRPSMLPADWCKYELTVYPCNDQLGSGLGIR